MSPTPLQGRILAFIAEFIQERGYPPTLREIGRRLRIGATSSVAYHLKALQAEGLLRREESLSRGLAPVEHPFRLPILGRVGAGRAVIAQEDVEGHLTLDKTLARGASFLLRVRGDSMEPELREGDLVLVRRQDAAEEGELVVALVQEEAFVKRLKSGRGGPSLESANPAYPPIIAEFSIVGKALGLIRAY